MKYSDPISLAAYFCLYSTEYLPVVYVWKSCITHYPSGSNSIYIRPQKAQVWSCTGVTHGLRHIFIPQTVCWPVIHNALHVCHGNGWQGTRWSLAAFPALHWIQPLLYFYFLSACHIERCRLTGSNYSPHCTDKGRNPACVAFGLQVINSRHSIVKWLYIWGTLLLLLEHATVFPHKINPVYSHALILYCM